MRAIRSEIISVLFVIGAIIATVAAAYFSAGREMNSVIVGVIAVAVLFICFFNVRLSLILLVMSMLLSPEIVVGSTPSRDITIRIDDIFLLMMTVGWIVKVAILKDLGFILKNPLNRPIAAFSGCAILSTVLGTMYGTVSPMAGFFFVGKFIEYFFLFGIMVNFLKDRKEVNQILTLMLVVCGIICVYCLFQVARGGDVAAPFEGSVGEKNTLGGYLVLLGSVAIGVMINSHSWREKLILAAMMTSLCVVIMFSLSRSSWISIFVTVIVFFFYVKHKLAYLSAVLVAAVIIAVFIPDVVIDRFMYTFTQKWAPHHKNVVIGGVRLDTSLSGRFFDYWNALRRWPEHPIFGFGVTGFAFLDGQFFRVLIETGVVGLSAFLWVFVRLHKLIRQAMKAGLSPRLHGMTVGFYAGFWAMLAHALSANTFIIVRIAEPFWCLAALTVTCLVHSEIKETSLPEETGETQKAEYIPYRELIRRGRELY